MQWEWRPQRQLSRGCCLPQNSYETMTLALNLTSWPLIVIKSLTDESLVGMGADPDQIDTHSTTKEVEYAPGPRTEARCGKRCGRSSSC